MDSGRAMALCPVCGLCLPDHHCDPLNRFNASGECWQRFSDLSCSTLARQDAEFGHPHRVDTYTAQHSGGTTRNITVAFGLIGLYLSRKRIHRKTGPIGTHADRTDRKKTGHSWNLRLSLQELP